MKENTAYQTISETSKLLNIPTHVLRFWEKKFTILKPKKSSGGRRYYSVSDFKKLNLIKELLYEKGYTINGAINALDENEKFSNFESNVSLKNEQALEKLEKLSVSVKKIKKILENY